MNLYPDARSLKASEEALEKFTNPDKDTPRVFNTLEGKVSLQVHFGLDDDWFFHIILPELEIIQSGTGYDELGKKLEAFGVEGWGK